MSLNLNQTLQSKYPHLEISVLNLSDAMKDNDSKRIDSEYFKREYLSDDALINRFELKNIGDFAFITDGQHGYHEVDENSEIHLLTAKNVKNWFANLENAEPLAKWVDDKNQRSSLKDKDILVSTRGTVGYCAIVDESILPAQIDQDIARVKLENSDFISEFIIVYLNSKFGQDWFRRNQTGMVQQGISLAKLSKCPIPLFPLSFQQEIETLVKASHKHLEESKALYAKAEALLYAELGLNPHNPLDFIARHSERSDSVAKNLNISTETKDSSPTA
ncbi:MAG: restriction endonuclease subunit S, partial [Neisseriaceae bacterium]|nr:restriction endonuclease subunit S [Neisseriaceae bacterium]